MAVGSESRWKMMTRMDRSRAARALVGPRAQAGPGAKDGHVQADPADHRPGDIGATAGKGRELAGAFSEALKEWRAGAGRTTSLLS